MKKKYKISLVVLGLLMSLYIMMAVSVKDIEAHMTFPMIGSEYDFSAFSKETEKIHITTPDGNEISGIYIGSGTGKTVFYFHPNGGSLSDFSHEIKYIQSFGYNVMAYDYPGYGDSTGFPYEKNIQFFSEYFYNHVSQLKGFKEQDIILWGYSVGTAGVGDFVSRHSKVDKIILFTPFTSRFALSPNFLGIPLQKYFFQRDSFTTQKYLKNISQPVLLIHGNTDQMIPFFHSEKIYNTFSQKNNKYLLEIENQGHNGIIGNHGIALYGQIGNFLQSGKIIHSENHILYDLNNKESWEAASKLWSLLQIIDLQKDDSIQKFVTSNLPFIDKEYIPEKLVSFGTQYVRDGKGNGRLREEAAKGVQRLGKKFYEEFGIQLTVNSSYRSYIYQQGIKNRGCPDNLCAKAGFSEHQSGLAIDVFDISNDTTWNNSTRLSSYYNWLAQNAHLYGFTNTYQKGIEIDGYDIEPWHWRYVGVDLASYLVMNNMTIAEFYNLYVQ
ncbi:MAG: prolyl oligopeptidase family serine peptidase [Candidatus Gracilibacteria bacterium]|nr:prolyl oligopeptidase family serine peptidase [Candidatus Gracilibacteria bacterium]